MPRRIQLSVDTPVNVELATEAFASNLRVNLIRHFRLHPGKRRDAAEALGVPKGAVSHNVRVLIACGVLVEDIDDDDGRSSVCRVDLVQLEQLIRALGGFTLGRL